MTRMDAIDAFKNAIADQGLTPPENIVTDGSLQRYRANGDNRGQKSGWYVFHGGDLPAGAAGNWKTGADFTWCSKSIKGLSAAEKEEYKRRMNEAKRQREAQRQKEQEKAKQKADKLWKQAKPAPADHPYLLNKGVSSHGLKLQGKDLLVPMRNSAGKLSSLQFIKPDGSKMFLKDGAVKTTYHAIGKPNGTLLICEGYATAASLHEATGHAVACAFNAGNLMPVAQAMRKKYPELKTIICGDNDMQTEGNPGATKATEAARATGSLLAIPKFKDTSTEPTDFNDMAAMEGPSAVREQVAAARAPEQADDDETYKSYLKNAALGIISACDDNKSIEALDKSLDVIDKLRSDYHKGSGKALVAVSLVDFLQQEHPPRVNILNPWLPEQGLCLLHAWRGVGKTHISCGVGCAVAAGDRFLNWEAPSAQGVLLIDGEMPARVLQERLQRIILGMDKEPTAALKIITPDNQPNGMPDLGTKEGQLLVEEHITDDIKLIIVDNISTLVRTGRENEAEGWLPVQGWFLKLRAAGKSVLAIHHSNKSGKSRGTSKREDVLDTVLRLEHGSGYTPDQGACFEVHYEKNRGIYGEEVKPFEAQLITGENGEAIWATRTIDDSTYDKVVKLANEGLSKAEIATELEIHKSSAGRHYNKGVLQGDIKHEKK